MGQAAHRHHLIDSSREERHGSLDATHTCTLSMDVHCSTGASPPFPGTELSASLMAGGPWPFPSPPARRVGPPRDGGGRSHLNITSLAEGGEVEEEGWPAYPHQPHCALFHRQAGSGALHHPAPSRDDWPRSHCVMLYMQRTYKHQLPTAPLALLQLTDWQLWARCVTATLSRCRTCTPPKSPKQKWPRGSRTYLGLHATFNHPSPL